MNEDWLRFPNVNFGNGNGRFSARVSASRGSGQIEIREGGVSGLLLGEVDVPKMKDQQNYVTVSGKIKEVKGRKDIYLVFKGKAKSEFELDWFSFEK